MHIEVVLPGPQQLPELPVDNKNVSLSAGLFTVFIVQYYWQFDPAYRLCSDS